MTRSFIFNCDDFVPNENGGVFLCGERKFALVCRSTEVIERIYDDVKRRTIFQADTYPKSVLKILLQKGLLRTSGSENVLSDCFFFLKLRSEQFISTVQQSVLWEILLYEIKLRLTWLFSSKPVALISESLLTYLAKPLAFFAHPLLLISITIAELFWFWKNHGLLEVNVLRFFSHNHANGVIVALVLIALLVIHELMHQAGLYRYLHKTGDIVLCRFAYFLPFPAATLPGLDKCSSSQKIWITASGPILQIACAICLLTLADDIDAIKQASAISIFLGLINLIPYPRSDGYWILVEALNGQMPKLRIDWSNASALDIAYTAFWIVLAGLGVIIYGFI